jgi:uncharacterized protein
MDPQFVLIPVMAAAGFVQAVSGFGSALVAMPILAQLFGTRTAAPMFAIAAITGQLAIIVRYRQSFTFAGVWRLGTATIVAIPVGIIGSAFVSERLLLAVLGVLVLGFALYALIGPQLPRLRDPRWAYAFGFASGLFAGAFNTGGPPYVIYGTTQRWSPATFKANLQAMFVIGSLMVMTGHAIRGNFTVTVVSLALLAIPSFHIGILVGASLDRFVNPAAFRRGVLVLLVGLGLTLIF